MQLDRSAQPLDAIEPAQTVRRQTTDVTASLDHFDSFRLSEDDSVATAQEQERSSRTRAAELAKVNEALRRGLDHVTDFGRLDAFVTSILVEGAAVFAADAAAVLLRDGSGTRFRLFAVVDDGRLLDDEEIANDEFLGAYSEVSERDPGGIFSAIVTTAGSNRTVFDESLRTLWPEAHAWHVARGHKTSWQFPLRIRGQVRGFFAFAMRDGASPTTVQQESVNALAQLVTMAVEMTQLAEKAREAAVAREQENAAREHAVDLQRANDALLRRDALMTALADATKRLLGAVDFDAEVPAALGRIGAAVGLHRVKVILAREPAGENPGTHDLAYEWWAEGLVPQKSLGPTEFAATDIATYIERGRRGDVSWETIDEVPARLREAFRRVGMRSMGVVPVFVGEDYAGVVAFDDCERVRGVSTPEIEMLTIAARTIGAAIHRQRLERTRAAELAKANQVLRKVNERLAAEREPSAALRFMLREISALIGNDGAALYRYAPAERSLRFVCGIEAGEILDRLDRHPYGSPDQPVPVDAFPAWSMLCAQRVPVFTPHLPELTTPPSIDYHRERGHRLLVQTALMVGGEPLGLLGLAFKDERRPSESRLEMLDALAQQAAMALQLERLANDSRDAAIVREKERAARERAIDLGKANDALSRSTAQLASSDDLSNFLNAVLHEAIVAAGAVSGAVFLHDSASDSLHLRAMVVRGKVVDIEADPAAAAFREPIPAKDDVPWREMSRTSGIWWMDYANPRPGDWPQSKAWHDAMGHRFVPCIAMLHGATAIGFLGLAFDRSIDYRPSDTRLEVVRVLAQQATLAVRLTRLADEARSAAIARAGEDAAELRAANLSRANDMLRSSVLGIGSDEHIDTYVERMLRHAMEVTHAPYGAVLRVDPADDLLRMNVMRIDGRVVAHDEALFSIWVAPFPWSNPIVDLPQDSDVVSVEPLETVARHFWKPAIPWHRERGTRYMVVKPLRHNSRVSGFLDLGFRDEITLSSEQKELVRALANQLGLVIALDDAAQAARVTEVLREREAAERARVSELMLMNNALRGSLERLTTFDALDEFLDSLVREAVEATGAASGAIFSHDESSDVLSLRAFLLHGERYRPTNATDSVYARPIAADTVYVWAHVLARRGPVWIDVDDPHLPLHPGSRDFHRRYGHRFSVALPVFHGERCLGLFSLSFDRSVTQRPPESRLEICRVLAQQAALAMRLSDLASHALDAGTREAIAGERNRIAGDIHDSLAQSFTSIAMQSEALSANLADSIVGAGIDDAMRRRLLHTMSLIERTARLGLAEARSSALVLRPSADDGGLIGALASLAERSDVVGSIDCTFDSTGDARSLAPDAEAALLRIAQEAVGNAMRHARATHVVIRLAFSSATTTLSIEDDGCGLPKRRETLGRGFGIAGMAARAEATGGEFAVQAREPSGTIVSVVIRHREGDSP